MKQSKKNIFSANRTILLLLGSISGIILLSFLSFLQKKIIGADINFKGFIIPITFGGTIGAILGYFIFRLFSTINKLRESEQKYRSLFEGSINSLIIADENNVILNSNHIFNELTGYTSAEITYLKLQDISTCRKFQTELKNISKHDTENEIHSGFFETELILKNGESIPVLSCIHRILLKNAPHTWILFNDLREKKATERKIFEAMLFAEEKERERYAKELHDGLGPILSTAMIYLKNMQDETDESQLLKQNQRTYELIKNAIQCTREISNNLSPEVLKRYGLIQAIHSFINKLNDISGIQFKIDSNIQCRLSEVLEFTIYRTIIELLNNSLKYSEANEIIIGLNIENKILMVTYKDNGIGFEPENNKNASGFGLYNLESRINKIGGKFVLSSSLGKGMQVQIHLNSECL